MAVRQINTVYSFIFGYVRCELPEYTVDVMVKVMTMWGTHTLKEGRENCTLKFKPWRVRTKLFETLKQRLNRYVKTRVKPDLPSKPACLRTWQFMQSDLEQDQNEGECDYLEPVPRHE